MQSRHTCLLLVSVLVLSLTVTAQTVAPAPTAAGYPFWNASTDVEKITRGNDGAIWIAQSGTIGRLTLKAGYKTYRVDPNNTVLTGIFWGPDNNVWFSTFFGNVGKLVPSTGAVTRYHISQNPLRDITKGPDGFMYAVDDAGIIYRISTSGAVTRHSVNFSISMIRKGPDGALWMMETFGRKIARMTTAGVVTNIWNLSGTPGAACGPTCAALTAGPDGNIWFTQNNTEPQIGRITMSGQITYFPLAGRSGAGDIVWGQDGNIWFTDPQDQLVGRITTSGVITYFSPVAPVTPDQFARLLCLSSSPDGNIYFSGVQDFGALNRPGVGKIVLNVPEGAVGTNFGATHNVRFSGQVGTFFDMETLTGGYFDATVSWGDGTSSGGTVQRVLSGSPSKYRIVGSHTYTKAGLFKVTVKISEPGDRYNFSMSSQASVR